MQGIPSCQTSTTSSKDFINMSAEELPLNIPVQSILDFLSCPVCMCELTDTHVTPCGHRYCGNCIRESVGRHHKCPCCNAPLQVIQLIKDPQYDELINTITRERDKAEKVYFDTLISTAASGIDNILGESGENPENHRQYFSPVEDILKKHLKQSLVAHERYYQELRVECNRRVHQAEAECQRRIDELHRQPLMEEELLRQKQEIKSAVSLQKESLESDMTNCASLVASAYDRYLGEHIPNLSILPVKVTLNILTKNIQIPDVELRPQENLEDVRKKIESLMEAKGDKIVKYGSDSRLICFGPFSRRSQYEMHQVASDLVEFGASHPDIFVLPDGCRPVLQFSLKPGSEIALYGMVQFESDLPKRCFAATFQSGEGLSVDYFSCKTCSFNWVCRSCMEVCHKDHSIVPYIMDHQPTWACCYCPKKKKCRIQDK